MQNKISSSTAAVAAAAAAATSASTGAVAQDLSPRSMANWDGFYVGASLGASWLDSKASGETATFGQVGYGVSQSDSVPNSSASNWLAGLQFGRNWQTGRFVYGAEADISWLGNKSTHANGGMNTGYANNGFSYAYNATTSRSSRVNAVATFRGRVGYDFNGTMPYFTAGLALSDVRNTWSFSGYSGTPTPAAFSVSKSSWQAGLVIGAGVEHQLSQQWTIRGEVLWIGIPNQYIGNPVFATNYGAHTGTGGFLGFGNDLTIAKIGMNYRF